jgi:transposase
MKGSVHMRATGKRYSDDFKQMIVEVYNTGKPIKEICEEYGVTFVTINNWINKFQPKEKIADKPIVKVSKETKVNDTNKDADKVEILRLKKENERISMENEILKKAIAIFSKDQNL